MRAPWLAPLLAMAAAWSRGHVRSAADQRQSRRRTASRAARGDDRARRGRRRPAQRAASTRPRRWRAASGCASAISRAATAICSSLSIDDRGEVTPLYPEQGASLAAGRGAASATRYLPDSLELTGAGIERIIVVLSDQPIDVEAARRAARAAYERRAATSRACPAGPAGRTVLADVRQALSERKRLVRAAQARARSRSRCSPAARRRPPRARRRCAGSRSSPATTRAAATRARCSTRAPTRARCTTS